MELIYRRNFYRNNTLVTIKKNILFKIVHIFLFMVLQTYRLFLAQYGEPRQRINTIFSLDREERDR